MLMSDFLDGLRRRARGTMLETADVTFHTVADGRVLASLPFRPELAQLTGLFHAGALLTLADSAATAACLYAVDPTGADPRASFPLAVQISANLIGNVGAGTVTAEANLVHRGRTTMVVETTVRDERGRLLLLVTSTHLVLGPRT
jgi:1,4-dihydroxy-2-naphthoyl-CoA hydrolase